MGEFLLMSLFTFFLISIDFTQRNRAHIYGLNSKVERATCAIFSLHCTKNYIFTNLFGANVVQKSAKDEEGGKYRICLPVFMEL